MEISLLLTIGNQKTDVYEKEEKAGNLNAALRSLIEAQGYFATAVDLLKDEKVIPVRNILEWIQKRKQALIQSGALALQWNVTTEAEAPNCSVSGNEDRNREAVAVKKFQELKCVGVPDSTFPNIIGLGSVKQKLFNMIAPRFTYGKLYSKLGLNSNSPFSNCLLYGFPGTGKTEIVKAFANYCKFEYLQVSPSDVLGSYVGESEINLKALFTAASTAPCILFFDEIDGLLGKQTEARGSFINEFLARSDMKSNDVIIFEATNHPYNMSDNVLRRFEHQIYVPLPNAKERLILLKHYFGEQVSCFTDAEYNAVAYQTMGYSGCDLLRLVKAVKLTPFQELQRTSFFRPLKQNGRLMFAPCDSSHPLRMNIKLNEIPSELIIPGKLTMGDFQRVLQDSRRSTDIDSSGPNSAVVRMNTYLRKYNN